MATRRAFTLVEVLIVIVILAALMALLVPAIYAAVRRAREARITAEINLLQGGLENYKTAHKTYPPGFTVNSSAASSGHQGLILRHLRSAFPRYVPASYAAFRTYVQTATDELSFSAPPTPFTSGLDVNNLDQAEALVFWLGGYPSTTEESKLIGFSLNPTAPFQYDANQTTSTTHANAQRTQRHFEFDPTRLVDRDKDGWWEYLPQGPADTADMPPYVYFDGTSLSTYPANIIGYPSDAALATLNYRGPGGVGPYTPPNNIPTWGVCVPYMRTGPVAAASRQWVESNKFQILSSGLDGVYSDRTTFNAALITAVAAPTVFPTAVAADLDADGEEEQLDNLSNFTETTFEDALDSE